MKNFRLTSLWVAGFIQITFGMGTSVYAQQNIPSDPNLKRSDLPAERPEFVVTPDYSLSHDVPENDPSQTNKKKYILKKPVPQADLLNPLASTIPDTVNGIPDSKLDYDTVLDIAPSLFDYLKINSTRYIPQPKNGLTTVNANEEYENISDREFGYCWGYATLQRYLHTLAFFDPHSKEMIPDSKINRGQWLKFYSKKLNAIANGRATIIPGYANLRQLSMVPEFEFHLKLLAMNLWKTRAAQVSSIPIFYRSTQMMDFDEVETLLQDLEARLARNEMPKILFTSWVSKKILGGSADIHAVLVYGVKRLPNHRARIQLWDINFYAESLIKKPVTLEIGPDHLIQFEPWYEANKPYSKFTTVISRVQIAPENDVETAGMIESLAHFCRKKENRKHCYAPMML